MQLAAVKLKKAFIGATNGLPVDDGRCMVESLEGQAAFEKLEFTSAKRLKQRRKGRISLSCHK
jgi:hypothetical protein